MSFLGGIVKSVINPVSLMQVAMGPAGWASLAVKTIGMAIGKEVIQQLGQKLGLPQSMINLAHTAFDATMGGAGSASSVRDAVGQVATQFAMSPAQQGALQRTADKAVNSILDQAVADSKRFAASAEGEGEAAPVNAKGGFLRAIAMALGQVVDAKMNEMKGIADKITAQASSNNEFVQGLNGEDPNGNQQAQLQNNGTQLGSLNATFQAVSQEMSVIQNVISTALKTIGESQSTVARKG